MTLESDERSYAGPGDQPAGQTPLIDPDDPPSPEDVIEVYGAEVAELAEREDRVGALARAIQRAATEDDPDA